MKKKGDEKKRGGEFTRVGDILKGFQGDEDKQSLSLRDKQSLPLRFSQDKYISHEFQKYGYELAEELGDLKHKSLYIKLAKEAPRGLLEMARNFVKDASSVKSKPKLFMWKLSELKKGAKLAGSEKLKTQVSKVKTTTKKLK